MGKELELLQKMDLTAENRQKLEALITEAKKTGKVSSKHLVETLDDVDATQDQTERFYDILEQAGIEIDVSDVLDLIGTADMDNPTLSEMLVQIRGPARGSGRAGGAARGRGKRQAGRPCADVPQGDRPHQAPDA